MLKDVAVGVFFLSANAFCDMARGGGFRFEGDMRKTQRLLLLKAEYFAKDRTLPNLPNLRRGHDSKSRSPGHNHFNH